MQHTNRVVQGSQNVCYQGHAECHCWFKPKQTEYCHVIKMQIDTGRRNYCPREVVTVVSLRPSLHVVAQFWNRHIVFEILGSSKTFLIMATISCLGSQGSFPASRNRLIILVMVGARIKTCFLTKGVGIRSNPRDFTQNYRWGLAHHLVELKWTLWAN